jgi:RHS repeat-associated protein
VVKDKFEYTPQDRLAVHKHQINNLPEELITKNSYDELGQLTSKKVGGAYAASAIGLQTVDYSYNIRGWLKSINDVDELSNDLFSFKINYDDPSDGTALFNGSISETHWKTASDNIFRRYSYQYDHLNRLLEGNYKRDGGSYNNSYLEKLSYDKNGNIQSILRNGDSDANDYEFVIDELQYTYHTENQNQLVKVIDLSNSPQGFIDDSDGINDESNDYTYDDFGNLITDLNKNIEKISYNHLNLPVEIVFSNGKITYLYNATGLKLQKMVYVNDIIKTDYLNGFQYYNSKLKYFAHPEGYVSAIDDKFKYVYNYTDHLGNIRLSYSDANDDNQISFEEIIEENNYYPFGLKHSNYNTNEKKYIKNEVLNKLILAFYPKFQGDGSYNYKYNGKEYQDELGLNMYDYGARNYDPALGRWMNMDPLAEKYVNISTYGYCLNNPIIFVDPNGKEVVAHDKDAQDLILNALTELLGANHGFSFNKKGVMKHSGSKEHRNDKKNYSKEQMSIFEGFTEIMSNKEYTIDVFKQSGDDTSYSADFKNRNFSTDSNGQIIKDSNGNPILKEDGTVTTVDVTHPNAGETGGGVFLTKEGHKNAVSIIFPDIANGRKFKAFTGFTTPSVNSVTVHELLDHGLDFVRTGNNKASSTPSVSNVSYQNDALIIIQSNTRVGHDKQ